MLWDFCFLLPVVISLLPFLIVAVLFGVTVISLHLQVTDRFPFPMEIDMSEYTENGRSEEGILYELYAVIVHGGSCEGGHYTACIRDIDNLGYWEDPVSLLPVYACLADHAGGLVTCLLACLILSRRTHWQASFPPCCDLHAA